MLVSMRRKIMLDFLFIVRGPFALPGFCDGINEPLPKSSLIPFANGFIED